MVFAWPERPSAIPAEKSVDVPDGMEAFAFCGTERDEERGVAPHKPDHDKRSSSAGRHWIKSGYRLRETLRSLCGRHHMSNKLARRCVSIFGGVDYLL